MKLDTIRNCINCNKDITTIMGQFCSEKCSEEWQDRNQKCSKCEKDMNLLEEQYTISQKGVLCQVCGHGSFKA